MPGPLELPAIDELVPDEERPRYPFWGNFEAKPIDFEPVWPPPEARPARWQQWLRFIPTSTFEDPWVDAARSLILVDLPSWPSAHRPHAWTRPPFTAPTLDLNVAFHPRPSIRSGCCATARRRSPLPACSGGPPGCGLPAGNSMRRAADRASTDRCRPEPAGRARGDRASGPSTAPI